MRSKSSLLMAIFVLVVIAIATSCKTQEVVTANNVERISGSRTEKRDSIRHDYKIEVIRVYHPETNALEREEVKQEGVIDRVIEQVADTIYIERVDTLYVAKGASAPIHPSVTADKIVTKATDIIIFIVVLAISILTINWVIKRKYKVNQ